MRMQRPDPTAERQAVFHSLLVPWPQSELAPELADRVEGTIPLEAG
ncbi:hypothetical protein J2R76_007043 [Bradyrhizobium sp. USDA 4532]|nr:hypothetical protein [Bradyrhizobium sp. USDA 4545]MCP1923452.1 hypothetical protein [Bradyrhizobium sp. USDA 4532]